MKIDACSIMYIRFISILKGTITELITVLISVRYFLFYFLYNEPTNA